MKRGYTLVEVLVSIAIFIILLTVVIGGFRGVSSKDRVKAAGTQIVSMLRQTRNMAFNGIADSTGNAPVGGYGLQITSTHWMQLFVDSNNSQYFNPASDEKIGQNVSIDSRVKIVFETTDSVTLNRIVVLFNGADVPLVMNQLACMSPSLEHCTQYVNLPIEGSLATILTLSDASGHDPCTIKIQFSNTRLTDGTLYITSTASQC
ncbi:MAG: type II secretion system protein [Candidatus Komeilibacteria bacterium]